ncbi:hypothetical protein IQ13_4220 [Lacibacter cauensis]|uniref:Uncharacterized protein n=1 Tax=Lacibacter cauensis TaxID=510947 RepID=A0A562S9B1_9BACT|nr:hypothetical protein [Lacibacter cauensis]TWI77977.1 hypothetical protein IQ13_4220 [Lacibacter cauensis]
MDTLNWGQVTPEAANIDRNEFVYIYNHDLSSPEKIDRTIRFIVGRLNYYDTQLPKDPIHLIKIDARGQQLSNQICDYIKNTLLNKYLRPDFLTIEIIK